MIDTDRQLTPQAHDALSIDLTGLGGPRYVVPMASEHHASGRIAQHLVELGNAETVAAGTDVTAEIPAEPVAVTR
jgi:hypothetical protein